MVEQQPMRGAPGPTRLISVTPSAAMIPARGRCRSPVFRYQVEPKATDGAKAVDLSKALRTLPGLHIDTSAQLPSRRRLLPQTSPRLPDGSSR